MAFGEGFNGEGFYLEGLTGLNGNDLGEFTKGFFGTVQCFRIGVDRQLVSPRQDPHTLDVIRMFMGHHNGIETFRRYAHGFQTPFDLSAAQARIHQDSGISGFDIAAIPTTPGREDGKFHCVLY